MKENALAAGPPAKVTEKLAPILDTLAWCATAAGVMGLLIVGMRMAVSLRRGQGEEHLVQFATVMGACIIASTAGPLVTFLL